MFGPAPQCKKRTPRVSNRENASSVTPGTVFSAAVPEVDGIYGGFVGYPLSQTVDADFGAVFLAFGRVWLKAIVVEDPPCGSFLVSPSGAIKKRDPHSGHTSVTFPVRS